MSLLRIYRTTSHHLPRLRPQQFPGTSFRYQSSITIPRRPVAIPYTDTCPSPTCECTATTPADLDIDRKSPLLNTVAAYAEQVVICTGQEDWASRIENDEGETGDFVRGLKGVIGKGSAAFDPFNNILLTASSLPKSPTHTKNTTSVLLFPQFTQLSNISHDTSTLSTFATAFLKAKTLNPYHDGLSAEAKTNLTRDISKTSLLPTQPSPITTPTILICGHGTRDNRCGIMGPLLQSSFEKELQRKGISAQVAQISHVGGHKYAGNVIIYVPPNWQEGSNALAGAGIWYGRVGPEHVEGLVEETLVRGRVVLDLLRGGIVKGGGDVGRLVERERRQEKWREEQIGKGKPPEGWWDQAIYVTHL